MIPVARVGDTHVCPRHGTNSIISGGQSLADGRAIARQGDKCACGATITEGSGQSSDNGRGIAYLGCKTSHGGIITSGSDSSTVKP